MSLLNILQEKNVQKGVLGIMYNKKGRVLARPFLLIVIKIFLFQREFYAVFANLNNHGTTSRQSCGDSCYSIGGNG